MTYADKIELDHIKRTGYQTDRERVLLEALEEAEQAKKTLDALMADCPAVGDKCFDDLQKMIDFLEESQDSLLFAEKALKEVF